MTRVSNGMAGGPRTQIAAIGTHETLQAAALPTEL